MPAPKVPDEFFNHLLELRDLELRGQSPEGQAAAQAELSNLDLYQVAANASEERDPATMGEIEQLLRRGDFNALQARLGSGLATEVRDRYLDAFRQVEAQKGIQRTGGEMVTDAVVGTPASFVNMLWTGEMLAGGAALGPEYMATSAERNVEFNREIVDPLLSDALKARRMVAGAVDAADQREHALEAQRELAAGGNPLEVTAKRLAKDFGSGIANTVEDPTLLAQGLVEVGASMGTTALLSKGFAKIGQAVVARQAARITNQAIARGTAKEIAEKIGERVTRQMASNANKLAWAAAAGTAEGTGAYQQTVLDVLSMSTDELAKSSEDFRELVKGGMSPVEAQRTIAHRAGLLSAGLTGVMGAGIGHLLGQGGASPTKIVQSFTKDVLEEGIEEGLQGMSGQLAGNYAQQLFADPNKDVLEGVGFSGGQGAILGLGSAGVMKTPGLASTREAQIAAQGVRTAAEAVGTLGATVADKRLAAEEAKSAASVQALAEQIGSLNESGKAGRILEAANALKPTGEEAAKINAAMNSLVNSHYVNELPASVNDLKPENKALFEKDQDLADAADKAARALLTEKDAGEQLNLALTLNGLLEPLRRDLGNSPELARVKENEQAAEVINEYSEVLANIANLPSVKRALSRVEQVLGKQKTVALTDENINTPEGQKTVQIEAARAVLSPGTGNAENIERILLHSEGDGLNLTPSQRIALKGSQALIQAREQIEQRYLKDAAAKAAQVEGKSVKLTAELVKKHLTPQQRTGSQVTVGMDPRYLEEGKYSAKQHTDRIIKAMMAGDTETAQEYLQDAALFAEHMSNKVGALNTHFEKGNPKGPQVPYLQLTPDREWILSTENTSGEKFGLGHKYKGEYVNTTNPASIEHAQEVAAEAELLHNIVVNLRNAFPELQVQLPDLVQLNPALRGDAKAISKKIRSDWAKQQQAAAQNQVEEKKAPAPAKQETPKPKTVKKGPVAAKKAEKKKPSKADQTKNEDDISAEEIAEYWQNEYGEEPPKADDDDLDLTPEEIEIIDESIREWYAEPAKVKTEVSDAAITQIKKIEAGFKGRELEHGAAVDGKTGKVIAITKGQKYSFTFSAEQVKAIRENGQAIVTHNHPGLLSFSIEDVIFAIQANLAEMRAITPDGTVWSLKRPENGWTQITDPATKFENFQSGNALEWPYYKHAYERMSAIVTKAGGNVADGVEAKGFDRDVWESIVAEEKAAAFNRVADENGWGWRIDRVGSEAAVADGDGTAEADSVPAAEEVVLDEKTTVADVFASLVQKGTNYFHKVFKLRKVDNKPATRTFLSESPLEVARQAMDGKGFKELTGKDNVRLTDEIAEHYEGLVRVVGAKLVDALNDQLKAALGAHLKNAFDGEKEPHRYVNGKLLNIVEQNEDGTYRFNRNLQESAVLAALQWWISASQRQTPIRDDEDIADQHDLDVEDISPEDLLRLQAGQSLPEAKRSLATFVRRFWGVSGDPEGLTGYTEGIPEAMAAEMLDAFEAAGLLHIDTVEVQEKTIDRYHLEDLEVSEGVLSPVYAYPSAIEDAVVVDAEPTTFFEDDKVPLSSRQMSNPNVRTTKEQDTARRHMQDEKFYLNVPMVNWILGLGEEGIIKAFGTVLPENAEEIYNKGHLASLRGKNTSILGAFKELQRVKMEMESEAKARGIEDISLLGKKYAYAVSSVNRIVMQGAHNPQASKLMRESLMSTWSTLDMSDENGAHWKYFMLATAQALGIKVHRQTMEANIAEADAKLKELKPAIDVLEKGGSLDEYQAALKAAGVNENSFLLTYTLQEHARLRTADKKSFRTALYLEADGMTNGPFNAMGLLTVGEFTAEWIENVKKGGVSFGQTPRTADTLAEHKRDDLYQAGVNRAQEKLSERLEEIEGQPQGDRVGGVARMLHEAMAILLPDDVSIREDGTLELQRGIGKNPMTVLIYGSGVKGIANKLTHNLTKKFYEKLSEAIQSGKPLDPKLRDVMNVIAGVEVAYGKTSGEYYIHKDSLQQGQRGPLSRLNHKNGMQSFEFTKQELKRIQSNFQYLFVESMRDGIQDVLGKSVFESGALIRKATQVQSIVARDLFMKAIVEAVEAKKKADPNYKADSEFLSRKELEDIWDRLLPTMPMVHVDNQAFLVAKNKILEFFSESVDKKTGKKTKRTLYEFSRSLAGHRRTSAYVMAVDNAGVSAIPYLTIGMGDARMVRKIFQEAFERSMQVYDGINIPVDKIPEYGKRINEAALYAWQGNIFQGVGRAFDKFLSDPRVADALATNPELLNEIAEQLDTDPDLVGPELNVIAMELDNSALSMQARRIALNGVAISMDQMAGTFAPFVSQGMDIDTDASPADVKDLLNERYQEAMKTLLAGRPQTDRKVFEIKKMEEKPAPAPAPAKVEKPRSVPAVVPNMGRKSATGVRILRKTAIKNMPKVLGGKLTKGEAELLGEITRSGTLDDHEIIIGDSLAISRYIQEQGRTNYLTAKPGQQIHGFYSPSDKALYVISEEASVETLLHEMVHAATLSTVDAYYAGKLEGDAHKEVREAVERLEKLKDAFLQEAYTTDSVAMNAAQEILAKRHDPAAALNEFMAWSLANRDLGAFLNRTTGPLAKIQRLAELAYRTIKRLIWGRKQAPKFADDVLAQVRFNTAIIVRSQPNIEGLIRDGTLLHASLAGVETTRLSQLREAFARKIARHLRQRYTPEWAKLMSGQPELSKPMQIATELATEADLFFGMDGEEAHTFTMIVTALSTEAEINPHSMVRAQELYTDFINGLHPSDFLTGTGTQADEHAAQQKHDFIKGSTLKKWDVKGRSSILPVFLALALTNEQFRSVLAKKQLAKAQSQEIEGLDTALENIGQAALDSLSDTLAGTKKPANVLQAIDQLGTAVVQSTLDEQAFLDKQFEYVNGLGRGLNAKMVALLRKVGAASLAKGDELRESDSKLAKGLGAALEGIAALTSEREGAVVAERAIEAMDKNAKIWEPLRDFAGDLVGRTGSAAKIYDMVKRVRSHISQARQQYREKVPLVIKSKFTRKLTVDETDMQHRVMGRFDMASLTDTMSTKEVLELAANQEALKARIADGVSRIQDALPLSQSNLINEKIDQYVKFVQERIAGPGLLTNANAIAALLTEQPQKDWVEVNKDTVREIDQLITLKLLDGMSDVDRKLFSSLVQDEMDGMVFTLDYLKGQRKTELEKVQEGPAFYNHFKGHLPTEVNQRGKLVVELDTDHVRLRSLGYVRVAPYKGSSLETGGPSKSYYYAPNGGTKTPFQQGIVQNVQQTAYGIHQDTGHSLDQTAGVIRDPVLVNKLAKRMHLEKSGTENLRPIFAPSGKVVAFERMMDPEQLARVQQKQDLPKMIGHWRGRQVEEIWAQKVNSRLVDYLYELWQKDRREGNEDRYVNLLDEDLDDPVLRDAVSLMPRQMRTLIRSKFGKDQFYVRRSMVNYVVGYRNASVGDFWTGNTRFSEQTQETMKKAMIAILGIEAYRKLVNVEKNWQAAMFSARTNIVVRSVVVPAANIVAGIYQLMGRGVSVLDIARGLPKKIAEIESYTKALNRQVEIEAELRANENNVHLTQELKAELQTLKDTQRRLSIWPLLEAGEFSTISDVGQTADDLGITSGNMMEAMAKKVDELPPFLRDALRQGYMARDTAIFRTLQKSVQYGDFVMKAIYFDHMLKNDKEGLRQSMEYPQHAKKLGMQKAMEAVALGRITEEFNNYDVPTGRARGYLESIGMAWFLNYKIRATKIAVRMVRDNPLQSLLMLAMPHPFSAGTPVTDNLFAKLFEGTLGFSLTPSMALQPIAWNPWYNMVD